MGRLVKAKVVKLRVASIQSSNVSFIPITEEVTLLVKLFRGFQKYRYRMP